MYNANSGTWQLVLMTFTQFGQQFKESIFNKTG